MKEFKGTEGDWKIFEQFEEPLLTTCDESGDEWYHLNYWIMDENNKIIGDVAYQTESNNGGWGTISNLEEMKSNAKLIAAAPGLLKALQLVKYGYTQQTKHNDLSSEHKGIHNIVNEAITKALGE